MKQINIKLSDKAYEDLEELRDELNMPSISELVRSSIGLRKFLQTEKTKGNDFVILNKMTKEQKNIVFLN